ncbi:MAG: DNA-directed RNA polymerase subunit alpha C-terminal domain-containing protein [Bdellovibrionales bacterium]
MNKEFPLYDRLMAVKVDDLIEWSEQHLGERYNSGIFTRLGNILRNDNIVYLQELLCLSSANLLRIPNSGRKSGSLAADIVSLLGLELYRIPPGSSTFHDRKPLSDAELEALDRDRPGSSAEAIAILNQAYAYQQGQPLYISETNLELLSNDDVFARLTVQTLEGGQPVTAVVTRKTEGQPALQFIITAVRPREETAKPEEPKP